MDVRLLQLLRLLRLHSSASSFEYDAHISQSNQQLYYVYNLLRLEKRICHRGVSRRGPTGPHWNMIGPPPGAPHNIIGLDLLSTWQCPMPLYQIAINHCLISDSQSWIRSVFLKQ